MQWLEFLLCWHLDCLSGISMHFSLAAHRISLLTFNQYHYKKVWHTAVQNTDRGWAVCTGPEAGVHPVWLSCLHFLSLPRILALLLAYVRENGRNVEILCEKSTFLWQNTNLAKVVQYIMDNTGLSEARTPPTHTKYILHLFPFSLS